ncbi:HK97 gp10 family phage protein [Bacillus sp. FSL R10-2780]|uniref:HK97 gp10 family phage protein n=1 Tax=Bacillus sp. FSL R10-2780 TaxID=2954660 RepID=UPI0030FB3009
MSIRIDVSGFGQLAANIGRYNNQMKQNVKEVVDTTTTDIQSQAKAEANVDTGDMRRKIEKKPTVSAGGTIRGSVQSLAEYTVHVNYGHMVRAGQIFFDRKSKSFKRVKRTRFIPGSYFFTRSVTKGRSEFSREIGKALRYDG